MPAREVLALFAKAPVAGQVKTRLCPPLEPSQAAALYEAMLLDILDQHAAAQADLALWHAPASAADWFQKWAPSAYRLLAQRGDDLAARMRHLFHQHAAEGYTRIVLRGTDSPTLPASRVTEAFAALAAGADLVLCPDRDGGYNLIGLGGPADALFELEMSTSSVLDATLERARSLGLASELLPAHHDVDTAADLALLDGELCDARTPRTRAWLVQARVSMRR